MNVGAAAGRPAPAPLVAAYLVAALACWLAAAAVLIGAAGDIAVGRLVAPDTLLAVHLVALGFLPLAVTGAALHILPTLLRTSPSRWRGPAALPLLWAGPVLAVGIARDADGIVWPASAAVTAGFVLVAWELVALSLRAPRGRLLPRIGARGSGPISRRSAGGARVLLTSRIGVLLSTLHAGAALVFGALLAERGFRPVLGIPHDRAIATHLNLAALGWLTLLLLTVGRTLGPMLALAPAAPRRRLPLEELLFTAGLWLLLAGLALGSRPLGLAGAVLAAAAVAGFAALMARVAREHRLALPEGPLLHLAAGLVFLAQAAVLGIAMLAGLAPTPGRLAAYALALLVGWAAGATLGHVGKLLSLSAWAWWPPGPRPKQVALYPRRLWIGEALAFAAGLETVVAGTLAGSRGAVLAGALLVALAAAVACAGAVVTLRAGRPALRLRPLPAQSPGRASASIP